VIFCLQQNLILSNVYRSQSLASETTITFAILLVNLLADLLLVDEPDLLPLFENTFDRKRISANPKPNPNPNPKVQYCFRTVEMTSFFEQVYSYLIVLLHYIGMLFHSEE